MLDTTLSHYRQMDLLPSETVSGRIGHIHDLFLTFDYEIVEDLPEDCNDIVVLMDKHDRRSKLDKLATHDGNVVLVAAPGDASFRPAYMRGRSTLPRNIVAAFVGGNEFSDGRVTAVPLGVRPNKLRQLKFVRRAVEQARHGLLYGNFTVNDAHYLPGKDGRPHIRHQLVEGLGGATWATLDISDAQRTDDSQLLAYYANLARHKFILSPEGTGVDCYRHWESLYLGAVPIVMIGPAMSAFSDLPILFTDDYSELTEDYLERQWERLSGSRFNVERLLKSFYRLRFMRSVARLTRPRFLCWGFSGTADAKFLDVIRSGHYADAASAYHIPAAPYVSATSGEDPAAWVPVGDVRLSHANRGVQIATTSMAGGGMWQEFETVTGAPFRLCATVDVTRALQGTRIELLGVRGHTQLAGQELVGPGIHRVEVDFLAESDRARLELQVGRGAHGPALTVRNVEVAARL